MLALQERGLVPAHGPVKAGAPRAISALASFGGAPRSGPGLPGCQEA
jgi:hypothetical protein